MPAIQLRDVRKSYPGGFVGLDDVTLAIETGELFVLLGPSGSGKSTLLRLLAGLEDVTLGSIVIENKEVTSLPPSRRGISYLGQRPVLYPHRSVRENLLFGLGGPENVNRWLVPDLTTLANLFGLSDLLERRPDQLSGGELQRVALGRAILRPGPIFLLDEPLSNLDGPLRWDLREILHLLQKQQRATMVYVTHDQDEALRLGDRLGILDRGRLVQVGAPAEVLARPATIFVARHLGWPPMSLDRGRLGREDSTLQLKVEGKRMIAPQVWEPITATEVVVGSRSRLGPELGDRDLPLAFLFDATTGRLLHAPPSS